MRKPSTAIIPFVIVIIVWCLITWGIVSLVGCSPAPNANDIRRAKPTVTVKPDTGAVVSSVEATEVSVREVVRIVKVASGENETQKRQIELLNGTIDDLNNLLADQDELVRAKFAAMQLQVIELEKSRVRQAASLAAAEQAANQAEDNLELAKNEIIRLETSIALAENEKLRLREGWDSAIATAVKQEELTAKADAKAAKNQYWKDSWWKWVLWSDLATFVLTCILWVGGILYLKANPTRRVLSQAASMLGRQ